MKPIARLTFVDPAFVERADECALIRQLIRPHFNDDQERLLIFGFDAMERLVGLAESNSFCSHQATLTPALVHQAFSFSNAAYFILAHNHPSGEPSPSRSDLDITKRLASAALLQGLAIFDHFILTTTGHFSFRSAGLL